MKGVKNRNAKKKTKFYKDNAIFHHGIRIGKKGKPFVITKFRTMQKDAHRDAEKILPKKQVGTGKFKVKDPRITKLGRILRKSHLDELPQLLNVLKKEMNMVGLRPLTRQEYRRLPEDIKKIYNKVGPGLIGIQYACKHFPPSKKELFSELRKFYKMWKKNKTKTSLVYAKRVFLNRISGKAKSR